MSSTKRGPLVTAAVPKTPAHDSTDSTPQSPRGPPKRARLRLTRRHKDHHHGSPVSRRRRLQGGEETSLNLEELGIRKIDTKEKRRCTSKPTSEVPADVLATMPKGLRTGKKWAFVGNEPHEGDHRIAKWRQSEEKKSQKLVKRAIDETPALRGPTFVEEIDSHFSVRDVRVWREEIIALIALDSGTYTRLLVCSLRRLRDGRWQLGPSLMKNAACYKFQGSDGKWTRVRTENNCARTKIGANGKEEQDHEKTQLRGYLGYYTFSAESEEDEESEEEIRENGGDDDESEDSEEDEESEEEIRENGGDDDESEDSEEELNGFEDEEADADDEEEKEEEENSNTTTTQQQQQPSKSKLPGRVRSMSDPTRKVVPPQKPTGRNMQGVRLNLSQRREHKRWAAAANPPGFIQFLRRGDRRLTTIARPSSEGGVSFPSSPAAVYGSQNLTGPTNDDSDVDVDVDMSVVSSISPASAADPGSEADSKLLESPTLETIASIFHKNILGYSEDVRGPKGPGRGQRRANDLVWAIHENRPPGLTAENAMGLAQKIIDKGARPVLSAASGHENARRTVLATLANFSACAAGQVATRRDRAASPGQLFPSINGCIWRKMTTPLPCRCEDSCVCAHLAWAVVFCAAKIIIPDTGREEVAPDTERAGARRLREFNNQLTHGVGTPARDRAVMEMAAEFPGLQVIALPRPSPLWLDVATYMINFLLCVPIRANTGDPCYVYEWYDDTVKKNEAAAVELLEDYLSAPHIASSPENGEAYSAGYLFCRVLSGDENEKLGAFMLRAKSALEERQNNHQQ